MLQYGVSIRAIIVVPIMRGRTSAECRSSIFWKNTVGGGHLNHPPYSPDLRSPDLFPEPQRGIRFPDVGILNGEVGRRLFELIQDMVFYVAFKSSRNGGNGALTTRVNTWKGCNVVFR